MRVRGTSRGDAETAARALLARLGLADTERRLPVAAFGRAMSARGDRPSARHGGRPACSTTSRRARSTPPARARSWRCSGRCAPRGMTQLVATHDAGAGRSRRRLRVHARRRPTHATLSSGDPDALSLQPRERARTRGARLHVRKDDDAAVVAGAERHVGCSLRGMRSLPLVLLLLVLAGGARRRARPASPAPSLVQRRGATS